MHGTTAWGYSAKAFEASRNEHVPPLLRQVFLRLGVAWFWAALALDGRALEVWRELHAQKAAARRLRRAAAWSYWRERLTELREGNADRQCQEVMAWSLPNSRRIRGLGLGCMWAVLCPYCREFHTHSPGEGRRTPHCCPDPERDTYMLEFAGALPAELHVRFHRSAMAGLPRLLHQWPAERARYPEAVELLAA